MRYGKFNRPVAGERDGHQFEGGRSSTVFAGLQLHFTYPDPKAIQIHVEHIEADCVGYVGVRCGSEDLGTPGGSGLHHREAGERIVPSVPTPVAGALCTSRLKKCARWTDLRLRC